MYEKENLSYTETTKKFGTTHQKASKTKYENIGLNWASAEVIKSKPKLTVFEQGKNHTNTSHLLVPFHIEKGHSSDQSLFSEFVKAEVSNGFQGLF